LGTVSRHVFLGRMPRSATKLDEIHETYHHSTTRIVTPGTPAEVNGLALHGKSFATPQRRVNRVQLPGAVVWPLCGRSCKNKERDHTRDTTAAAPNPLGETALTTWGPPKRKGGGEQETADHARALQTSRHDVKTRR
jgi:hypothetical protein